MGVSDPPLEIRGRIYKHWEILECIPCGAWITEDLMEYHQEKCKPSQAIIHERNNEYHE